MALLFRKRGPAKSHLKARTQPESDDEEVEAAVLKDAALDLSFTADAEKASLSPSISDENVGAKTLTTASATKSVSLVSVGGELPDQTTTAAATSNYLTNLTEVENDVEAVATLGAAQSSLSSIQSKNHTSMLTVPPPRQSAAALSFAFKEDPEDDAAFVVRKSKASKALSRQRLHRKASARSSSMDKTFSMCSKIVSEDSDKSHDTLSYAPFASAGLIEKRSHSSSRKERSDVLSEDPASPLQVSTLAGSGLTITLKTTHATTTEGTQLEQLSSSALCSNVEADIQEREGISNRSSVFEHSLSPTLSTRSSKLTSAPENMKSDTGSSIDTHQTSHSVASGKRVVPTQNIFSINKQAFVDLCYTLKDEAPMVAEIFEEEEEDEGGNKVTDELVRLARAQREHARAVALGEFIPLDGMAAASGREEELSKRGNNVKAISPFDESETFQEKTSSDLPSQNFLNEKRRFGHTQLASLASSLSRSSSTSVDRLKQQLLEKLKDVESKRRFEEEESTEEVTRWELEQIRKGATAGLRNSNRYNPLDQTTPIPHAAAPPQVLKQGEGFHSSEPTWEFTNGMAMDTATVPTDAILQEVTAGLQTLDNLEEPYSHGYSIEGERKNGMMVTNSDAYEMPTEEKNFEWSFESSSSAGRLSLPSLTAQLDSLRLQHHPHLSAKNEDTLGIPKELQEAYQCIAWLKDCMRLMQEKREALVTQCSTITHSRAEIADRLSKFDSKQKDLEIKYEQINEMNIFLCDLNGLFAAKRQPIDKAHQTLLSMEKGLAERIWIRKVQDAEEFYRLAMPAPSSLSEKDDVDEFGRSKRFASSFARKERVARRAARLQRRNDRVGKEGHLVRASETEGAATLSKEGWISSEESDEEKSKETLIDDRQIFSQAALDIFNDVAEDYKDMELLFERLLQFKKTNPSDYAKLFTSEILFSLVEPFILWQMLWWDPLNLSSSASSASSENVTPSYPEQQEKTRSMKLVTAPTLEAFDWYQSLVNFLLQQENSSVSSSDLLNDGKQETDTNSLEKEAQEDLLVTVVQKIVYPRVKEWITLWDITSLSQSKKLASVMQEMLLFRAATTMKEVADLLTALVQRMQAAMDSILVNGALSKLSTVSANRYLWQTVKISTCFLQFVDILSDDVLKDFVLTKLYTLRLSKLLNSHTSDHLDVLENFLMGLPSSWLTSAALPPPLADCVSLLQAFARYFASSTATKSSTITKTFSTAMPSSNVSRCIKLLQHLQAVSEARNLTL